MFGMSAAIVTLQLSLNPGKNDKNIHFLQYENLEALIPTFIMHQWKAKMPW
jgi:hypothetical protein